MDSSSAVLDLIDALLDPIRIKMRSVHQVAELTASIVTGSGYTHSSGTTIIAKEAVNFLQCRVYCVNPGGELTWTVVSPDRVVPFVEVGFRMYLNVFDSENDWLITLHSPSIYTSRSSQGNENVLVFLITAEEVELRNNE